MTRFWGSIASLPSSKSVDLFFFGAVAISVAILSEGFVRYMTHYFGSGFLVAGPALWVRGKNPLSAIWIHIWLLPGFGCWFRAPKSTPRSSSYTLQARPFPLSILQWATATITVLLNVALPLLAIQAHSRE